MPNSRLHLGNMLHPNRRHSSSQRPSKPKRLRKMRVAPFHHSILPSFHSRNNPFHPISPQFTRKYLPQFVPIPLLPSANITHNFSHVAFRTPARSPKQTGAISHENAQVVGAVVGHAGNGDFVAGD